MDVFFRVWIFIGQIQYWIGFIVPFCFIVGLMKCIVAVKADKPIDDILNENIKTIIFTGVCLLLMIAPSVVAMWASV